MILGIGVDLVSLENFAPKLKSDAFRRKVFTPAEIENCEAIAKSTEAYAGKFAAKEAFMKAIAKGIRQEVWFTQIEVLNHESGAPYIQINGKAKRIFSILGAENIFLSISHTDGMAVAMVVLESA